MTQHKRFRQNALVHLLRLMLPATDCSSHAYLHVEGWAVRRTPEGHRLCQVLDNLCRLKIVHLHVGIERLALS
jgi:hypothetical protein